MKSKKFLNWAFIALLCGAITACNNDDDNNGVDDGKDQGSSSLVFDGNVIGNGDQEFVFSGKETLAQGTYLLKGWVYIADGAELTIEPGTIIKGDKQTKAALIVEPGGKLYAQGTADKPIVFTSEEAKGNRRPGDWGGLIICGNARNNQGQMQIEGGPRTKHGGSNDADNSGIISYVRVEFARYPFERDKEINGVTFGSVGNGTQVDHVQVSYCNDDSYEWFGGTVNAKYLVAYKGWDDEFDTDNGFSGKVQFCLSVRDSRIADTSQSNGFESDNCADGAAIDPYTTATFSNITFIGPKAVDANFENTTDYINGGEVYPNNGSALGRFQAAMQIRRNSRLNCFNSIAIGYPIGLILDNQKGDTQSAATNGLLKLQNIWFADMDVTGSDANKSYDDVLVTGYDGDGKPIYDNTQTSFSSRFFLAQSGNKVSTLDEMNLSGAETAVGTNYRPAAGSPLLSAASFTDGKLASMQQVSYIGAFDANDNWIDGWTEFDPQNADY